MADRLSKAEKTLNRILDAALQCYGESGISGTRLEDVARVAGIGRTTLYRYVENRDDLLNKVLVRDALDQQGELEALIGQHSNLADSLVDTTVHVMRGRRNRPINRLLFGSGDAAMIDRVNLSPASFQPIVEHLLKRQLEQARGHARLREGVTVEAASDWLSRVILSLITYPEQYLDDERRLREFLYTFLVPSLLDSAE